jgi:hypothetical protein
MPATGQILSKRRRAEIWLLAAAPRFAAPFRREDESAAVSGACDAEWGAALFGRLSPGSFYTEPSNFPNWHDLYLLS